MLPLPIGILNYCRSLFAYMTLKVSSNLTQSVVGVLKRLFIIVGTSLYLHTQFSYASELGIVISMCGVWFYSVAKGKQAKLVPKRVEAK